MVEISLELADEQKLLRRAQIDPHEFAPIYDHYFPQVYNYVRYRVQNPQWADDLTAEVFQRILAKLHTYSAQKASFRAWLFAIARNQVNDHFRAQKFHNWISFDLLAQHSDDLPSPEQVVIRQDNHQSLLAAVQQLQPRERDIIALKFAAGLTNREIAKLLGLKESHVGVILYRSLKQLRVLVDQE